MDARTWHTQAMTPPMHIPAPPHDPPYSVEYLDDLRIALGGLVVPSEQTDDLARSMTEVVEENFLRPPGAQTMVSLNAPFSAGKSTLTTLWAQAMHRALLAGHTSADQPQWQPDVHWSADLVPVVSVTLISASGIKELNSQLLHFLGYPAEGVARVTTTRVVSALARHRVRVVVLDDAHMLRTSERGSREVLNYLKFLNSELGQLGGTMVLVGAYLDESALLQDPQIRGRLRAFDLRPFTIDATGAPRWQRFLRTVESLLLPVVPWIKPGAFANVHAPYLWRRTQGYLGDTSRLLTSVVYATAAEHRPEITAAHLDAITLSQRAHDAEADLVATHQAKSRRHG